MKTKKFDRRPLFIAALFIASVFVLGMKLMNPTPIQIVIDGDEPIINQIPGVFTTSDMIILVVTSIILGICLMYLLTFEPAEYVKISEVHSLNPNNSVIEQRKIEWENVIKTLKEDEQKIYREIIDSDGIINQSELTGKTSFSKSNVCRILDILESRGLVERRRRGMGNVVMLK